MKIKKQFTEEQIQDIIKMYSIELLSIDKIGGLLNTDKRIVSRILKENNISVSKNRLFTEYEKDLIVKLYITGEVSNKHKLGEMFKTSHDKIHSILIERGVDLENIFKTKISYSDYIKEYESKLDDDEYYVAICKSTNKEFLDYSNSSGALSKHIVELYPEVTPPSSFKRRNFAVDNDRFWHEDYFTITIKNYPTKPIKENYDAEIVRLYTTKEVDSTHKLGEMFKMGHRKISEILRNNGVELNKRGAKTTHGMSMIVNNSKTIKITTTEGKIKVAKCKKTGIIINDPMNLSGSLTNHLNEIYGNDIKIPTNTFQRKQYEITYGKKWFEEYFDIIDEEENQTRKCKLCDWVTEDITNKTGCFENHIIENHDTTIDDYLTKFPDDIKYHKTYKAKIDRDALFLDSKNYVICKLCSNKMKTISNTHLMTKHNITCENYKILYPNEKLVSETSNHLNINNYMLGNINMKPVWTSKGEIEVKEFIESLGLEVEKSPNRKLLEGKEIDLIIPSMKIGLEYNGLYHHTEKRGKHSTYHLNKTIACNAIGYRLIHIFEDEWVVNKELVKNKLRHIFNVNAGIKIGARKCLIKPINTSTKSVFLKENHIQGNDNSTICYGAYYKNELVGVITFTNKRYMNKGNNINEKEYELTRFAIKQNYIITGLASKMIKLFINEYNPDNIISFADRRWTLDEKNNLYTKLGFKLVEIRKPNYHYYNSKIEKNKRFHKFGLGKTALRKKYPELDYSKTEKQLTTELGYDRIWDCGLFKYELKLK